MAGGGMKSIKGGKTTLPGPGSPDKGFVLGSRPAVLRSQSLGRLPTVKPGAASTRNYGKPDPTQPFGGLGQGNTGQGGLS